jgi:hypothetical protein
VTDNSPIASTTDPETALRMKAHPIPFAKKFFGNGDVKFYLGENGFVREFRLPSIDTIKGFFDVIAHQSINGTAI